MNCFISIFRVYNLSADIQLFMIIVLFFTLFFCTISVLLNITVIIITKAELIYLVYSFTH